MRKVNDLDELTPEVKKELAANISECFVNIEEDIQIPVKIHVLKSMLVKTLIDVPSPVRAMFLVQTLHDIKRYVEPTLETQVNSVTH